MESVYPFFHPAAKKCKHSSDRHSYEHDNKATLTKEASEVCLEASASLNDTRSMSEIARPSCSHLESCVHTAMKSLDNPMQQQVTDEQHSSMATACQSRYDPSSQEPLFRSVSELGRRWCKFYRRCYRRERTRNFNFTIVSYNVLADGLLQSNSHLYTGTDDWLKSWEYRKRNLLQELLFYDADILCLQEIEEHHYQDWFEPRLKEKGYVGVYKKRTGNKRDGCATFFKESKFTLVKTKLVSFKVPGVRLMDRDNVAVVTLLRPGPAGQGGQVTHPSFTCLCIGNTHLLFNTKRGDIKLAQLAYLFAEIDEVARISPPGADNPLYHPIICCGDFNSTPFSPIYDFVTRGYLDYNGMHRDNFSGQNYFRSHYPLWQAVVNNLIPWELGITTSSYKRNDCEVSCTSESWNAKEMAEKRHPSVLTGNSVSGSEPCCHVLHDVLQQESYCNSSKTTLQSTQNESTQQGTASSALSTKVEEFNASTTQRHRLNFVSVYKHNSRTRREVTTFHEKVCTTVDYIFFSPGEQWNCRNCYTTHGLLQPTGILGCLTEEEIWLNLGGLPSKNLSSDHLALVASFLLHI